MAPASIRTLSSSRSPGKPSPRPVARNRPAVTGWANWVHRSSAEVGCPHIGHSMSRTDNLCRTAWFWEYSGLPRPGLDGPQPGRDLVLGLRPEHRREAQPDEPGAFELEIAQLEPTGADTFGFADINGRRAAVRLPPKRVRKAGERLHMVVDLAAACLFDPSSERRISA